MIYGKQLTETENLLIVTRLNCTQEPKQPIVASICKAGITLCRYLPKCDHPKVGELTTKAVEKFANSLLD